MELTKVEEGMVPIYENERKERLINARELYEALESKRDFSNWITDRIQKYGFVEGEDFSTILLKSTGGRPKKEYALKIDVAKEIALIENNEKGRNIRRYFIEVEKRYQSIISHPNNIFDFMRIALNQIEENTRDIDILKIDVKELKSKIDVAIQNNYCLASDIAEQLNLYSENNIPHSNFIGAIARELGYKISYKHCYEDEYIAIVKDVTKHEYWQVYFKPKAVEEITEWFNKNKDNIYYEIQYVRNTNHGKKGEVKEHGYKIEEVCYKVK